MKRKISLTALAIFLVCLLVFLPVVSASVYFTRTVSRQLEHNASETVAVYLDQFTEQTDRMLGTLRDCIYYLTTDAAARRMMQQESRVTQIEILQLEQQFSRAFTLGDSLNPDVVSAIYLLKSTQEYFAVYGGNYYRNTSRRILTMYQGYQDCNAARTLYTDPRNKGYAYMILDFVDPEQHRAAWQDYRGTGYAEPARHFLPANAVPIHGRAVPRHRRPRNRFLWRGRAARLSRAGRGERDYAGRGVLVPCLAAAARGPRTH